MTENSSHAAESVLGRALSYWRTGFEVVPLPAGHKAPPPGPSQVGFSTTGAAHSTLSASDLTVFFTDRSRTDPNTGETIPYANVGLVMPPGVVGLDVDAYDGKRGGETLAELQRTTSGLPDTYRSSSRDDGISGIYFYRCPDADRLTDLPGIDIIRPSHRYAVVAPSIHPQGRPYRWYFGKEECSGPGVVADLPVLPESVAERFRPAATHPPTAWELPSLRKTTSQRLREFLQTLSSDGATGTRHDAMRDLLAHLAGTEQLSPALISILRFNWSAELPERVDEFERALQGAIEKYTPDPDPDLNSGARNSIAESRVDLGRLVREGAPEPEWLIEPIIPASRVTILVAGAKSGKSLLLLEAVCAAATGVKFIGELPDRPVRTLYLDFEMTEDDLAERLDSMGYTEDTAASLMENLHYHRHPPVRPLDSAEGAADLLSFVKLAEPDLVVIDTWSRVISGSENDAETYQAFHRHMLGPLKAKGVAVVLADHTGHEQKGRSRGSSAKLDLADLAWTLKSKGTQVELKRQAQRISWAPESVTLTRSEDGGPIHRRFSGWPEGTKTCADMLDRLEVPLELGERKVRKYVKEHGEKAPSSEVLRAALKLRRERARRGPAVADAGSDAGVSDPSDAA